MMTPLRDLGEERLREGGRKRKRGTDDGQTDAAIRAAMPHVPLIDWISLPPSLGLFSPPLLEASYSKTKTMRAAPLPCGTTGYSLNSSYMLFAISYFPPPP